MDGSKGIALGSALIGVGLLAGLAIGRSGKSAPAPSKDLPVASSSRFTGELTDTTPAAAPPSSVEEVPAPPRAARQITAPVVTAAPRAARPAAAAPPPDAGAPPPQIAEPAPPPPEPEAVTPVPVEPPPDPALVQRGRVFRNSEVTSSSFDEEDVSEYSVVPDHEVTTSGFDDADRVNEHPTGP